MGYFAHGVLNATRRTKLIAAVLLFGALASAGFLVARREPIESKSDHQRAALTEKIEGSPHSLGEAGARAKALAEAGKDSDGDGLKDWEEEVFRTDPANADTDGDGTPDGEEIKLDRDPLKKGPGDQLAELQSETPFKKEDFQKNLTLGLVKNLWTNGALEGADENGKTALTDSLNSFRLPKNANADILLKPPSAIGVKDLKIIPQNDPAAIRKYFNSVYEVYARNIIPFQKRGDIQIISEVLQYPDYARLAELDPLIRALDSTIKEVKSISVPSGYQGFALQELAFLQKTKRAVEIFRNTDQDPIATALVIKPRLDLFIAMADFHAETKAKLDAAGIVFGPTEGGYAYFRP